MESVEPVSLNSQLLIALRFVWVIAAVMNPIPLMVIVQIPFRFAMLNVRSTVLGPLALGI
jgi:hypothetical protein